jgi:hypothetical protein
LIEAELDMVEIDEIFKNSNFPDSVSPELVNNILIQIRKQFYKVEE